MTTVSKQSFDNKLTRLTKLCATSHRGLLIDYRIYSGKLSPYIQLIIYQGLDQGVGTITQGENLLTKTIQLDYQSPLCHEEMGKTIKEVKRLIGKF